MLILVVDDHPLYRDALARLLPQIFADANIVQANDCDEAFRWLRSAPRCDIVLLDLDLPGIRGSTALTLMRREFPATTVVIVSASDHPDEARRCIAAGAAGFIPKSARLDVLRSALTLVREGGIYLPSMAVAEPPTASTSADATSMNGEKLTARELEVLRLLCLGHSNKVIANRLGIAEPTVRAHLSAVFRVLGVANRTQASREARRRRLVADN